MGVVGVGRFAMGARLVWYGCPPASMGVSTPTVEYNSPPMSHVNFGDDSALSAFTRTQWTAAFTPV